MTSLPAQGQDLNEMFQVFAAPDAHDAPLPSGTRPVPLPLRKARGDVHRDGDWHRSVHVWIVNSKGELLMQKRSPHKDTNPNMWDVSAAGHITAGDTSLSTACKELEEELGLRVAPKILDRAWWCTVPSSASGETAAHGPFVCNEFQDVYVLLAPEEVESAGGLQLGADEVSAVRFVCAAEVLDAWERSESQFVPRPQHYSAQLKAALLKLGF
eukprot:CAMPEP_0206054326 /NCGR_PEP_ID=MMETSP1466-20131121/37775_1 /ASSEMBLY_ACC=CAM_ASM_001126 /TAXON_ID=44452 /ORGANISM="Pavlova gyrans, Strain CCMP608" /LENGTH=212 /DNA_ID=CAMNT_0053429527 /DNA_START=135 /DNA_END=770 /DNA_ORIENTATION=-